MPRLSQVPRAETRDPLVRHVYEQRFGDHDPCQETKSTTSGAPGSWHTVLAASPDVFEHACLGFELANQETLEIDSVTRSLIQARTAWNMGSKFLYQEQRGVLRTLTAGNAKGSAVAAWEVATYYSQAERTALAYADCLTRGIGRVPDRLFDALRHHFSGRAILEITYIAAFSMLVSSTSRALRLEADDHEDPLTEAPSVAMRPGHEPAAAVVLPPRQTS